jgi:hypothetical protein
LQRRAEVTHKQTEGDNVSAFRGVTLSHFPEELISYLLRCENIKTAEWEKEARNSRKK